MRTEQQIRDTIAELRSDLDALEAEARAEARRVAALQHDPREMLLEWAANQSAMSEWIGRKESRGITLREELDERQAEWGVLSQAAFAIENRMREWAKAEQSRVSAEAAE